MNPIRSSTSRFLLSALLLPLAVSCAVNPATGERELSLVSEGQEIQMGREADESITASLGLVDDPELQRYVEELGARMAAVSERPDLPWEFHVVDDPVVNAFALPGGFIYMTRGILAHFESEAELAGVLGHEIGHVTARHSVSQMSRQQLQQLGLGVGMILSEDVRRFGDVLASGLGLLNLRYSRGDETQSDELGIRYMTRTGYDPEALVGVFRMLSNVSGAAEGRVPEWQLTHPYPENREEHIRSILDTLSAPAADRVGRDRYLDRIDGMVYGPDPREGYFRDELFLHPELSFRLSFPAGWRAVNQKTVVAAVSPEQDAVVSLQVAGDGATEPVEALRAFLGQEGIRGGTVFGSEEEGIRRARATFSARTDQGEVRGEALFARHDGVLYRILGYGSPGRWSSRAGAVGATLDSFGPVTDPAVLGVQPRRLEIVELDRDVTLGAFASRYDPEVVTLEELARLNRAGPGEVLPAGTRVKGVAGRPLP
jgi:predicted Zn-dependent protease